MSDRILYVRLVLDTLSGQAYYCGQTSYISPRSYHPTKHLKTYWDLICMRRSTSTEGNGKGSNPFSAYSMHIRYHRHCQPLHRLPNELFQCGRRALGFQNSEMELLKRLNGCSGIRSKP